MTTAQILERPPDRQALEDAIPMRNLQIALLNQQYAPTDPLFAKHPILNTTGDIPPDSDFGSDKVTLGDATSVMSLCVVLMEIQGGLSVPPSPMPMSRAGSMNPSTRERERQMREMLSKGLEKAYITTLSEEEVMTLTDLINKSPEMAIEIIEPTIQFFLGMIDFNAELFREIILPLLIHSYLREEYFSHVAGLMKNVLNLDIFAAFAPCSGNIVLTLIYEPRNTTRPKLTKFTTGA